jgi:hypothetical protein
MNRTDLQQVKAAILAEAEIQERACDRIIEKALAAGDDAKTEFFRGQRNSAVNWRRFANSLTLATLNIVKSDTKEMH